MVTGYLAGRYAGLAGVTVMILGSWVADGFCVGTLLLATVLVGGIWGFVQVVQRRADAARIAGSEAARVPARDPGAEADRVVLIRGAVADMRESARDAADLYPLPIGAVQTRGTEAAADVRRLLGLLRSERSEPPGDDPRSRRR